MLSENFSRVLPAGTAYAEASYGLIRVATRLDRVVEVESESLSKTDEDELVWSFSVSAEDAESLTAARDLVEGFSIGS